VDSETDIAITVTFELDADAAAGDTILLPLGDNYDASGVLDADDGDDNNDNVINGDEVADPDIDVAGVTITTPSTTVTSAVLSSDKSMITVTLEEAITREDAGEVRRVTAQIADTAGITAADGLNCYGQTRWAIDSENAAATADLKRKVISSCVPGAAVRIELNSEVGADGQPGEVLPGEDITIDFSDFQLPSSIDEGRVLIDTAGTVNPFDGNPSEVSVSGDELTLTIPTIVGNAANPNSVNGRFSIVFKQSAGITNASSAGEKTITISSEDNADDEIKVTVNKTLTIEETKGVSRGENFTINGKGFPAGTVTIFSGADGDIDTGELLGSQTASSGSFSATLKAGGKAGSGNFKVNTRDTNGGVLSTYVTIKSSTTIKQASAGVGGKIDITIKDWPSDGGSVAAVRIAGVDAHVADHVAYESCEELTGMYAAEDGEIKLSVTVPSGVPLGTQSVAIFNDDDVEMLDDEVSQTVTTECENDDAKTGGPGTEDDPVTTEGSINEGAKADATTSVVIDAKPLTISSSSVVEGQEITINGSNFPKGSKIAGIMVGGEDVESLAGSVTLNANSSTDLQADNSGNVVATFNVPLGLAAGDHSVVVTDVGDRAAQATVTIQEPSVTLDPLTSRRGTDLDVSGSGFPAGKLVSISYDGNAVFSTITDSLGAWSAQITVPNAGIPSTNPVAGSVNLGQVGGSDDDVVRSASTEHGIPAALINLSSTSAVAGSNITISGENFPGYVALSEVSIGGINAIPTPAPQTGPDGSFSASVLVPFLTVGSHTVIVTAGGISDNVSLSVVAQSAAPAPTDPADVFESLGDRLERVWYLTGSTQEWAFYDPDPELADFNSLTEVTAGEAYIVIITAGDPIAFQGRTLYAGSNNIPLR
jgi:hypothetical protein